MFSGGSSLTTVSCVALIRTPRSMHFATAGVAGIANSSGATVRIIFAVAVYPLARIVPSDATAVFLHLKLSGGQVEVHARMERGDYSAMNSNWSQLQQALAPQGIRLGALQEAATNHSTSAAAFGSFARDREERPSQKSFVPEPGREQPLPTRTTKVTLRVAPKLAAAKQHWESWA